MATVGNDVKNLLPPPPDDFAPEMGALTRDNATTATSDEHQFEVLRREHEIRKLQEQLTQQKDEHRLRKGYLRSVFCLATLYLVSIVVLVYLCACNRLHLSDAVLMMVLGTTAADVLGLLYIAFKWLFPKRSD